MKKNILKTIIFIQTLVYFFSPTLLLAQQKATVENISNNVNPVKDKAGVSNKNLDVLAGDIIQVLFQVLSVVFLILMVYGGIMWTTARGDSEQVDKARNTIFNSAIGLFISVAAYALTTFVTNLFLGGG